MADLRRLAPTDTERRGQILLVTGLALAVVFVGLALVFNSVIYTENLATRSESTTTSDPVIHKQSLEAGTERIIEYVNEYNATNASDHDAVRENVTWAFENMTASMVDQQLEDGQVVDDEITETYEGTWIRQTNRTRNFTNVDNESSWELASNANDVRSYRILVSTEGDLEGNSDTLLAESEEPFNVTVTDGIDEWKLNISETSESHFSGLVSEQYAVGYRTTNGDSGVCGVDSRPFVVDLDEGTINGTECPGLDFAEDFSSVPSIEYNHADNVHGTYQLILNDTSVTTASDYGTAPDEPFTDPGLYGVRVEVDYESDVLEYVTDFRVIPGETDA